MKNLRDILTNVVKSQKLNKGVLLAISRNCGFPVSPSSTKDNVITAITSGLEEVSIFRDSGPEKKLNILSIDMGIKNFSYCALQLEAGSSSHGTVNIHEWRKMNLFSNFQMENTAFTPLNYSQLSQKLIFELILKAKSSAWQQPDLILLERQRFRSMGSKAVLETVIRSAVLENMLFASLTALKALDPSMYKYNLASSSPLTMASYWDNYKTFDNQRFSKIDKKMSKRPRIQLVTNWILNSGHRTSAFNLSVPAIHKDELMKLAKVKNDSRRLYMIAQLINGSDALVGQEEFDGNMKGDDLADSLLHGVTWLEFEKNKQIISETLYEDPEALVHVLRQIETDHINDIDEKMLAI